MYRGAKTEKEGTETGQTTTGKAENRKERQRQTTGRPRVYHDSMGRKKPRIQAAAHPAFQSDRKQTQTRQERTDQIRTMHRVHAGGVVQWQLRGALPLGSQLLKLATTERTGPRPDPNRPRRQKEEKQKKRGQTRGKERKTHQDRTDSQKEKSSP